MSSFPSPPPKLPPLSTSSNAIVMRNCGLVRVSEEISFTAEEVDGEIEDVEE